MFLLRRLYFRLIEIAFLTTYNVRTRCILSPDFIATLATLWLYKVGHMFTFRLWVARNAGFCRRFTLLILLQLFKTENVQKAWCPIVIITAILTRLTEIGKLFKAMGSNIASIVLFSCSKYQFNIVSQQLSLPRGTLLWISKMFYCFMFIPYWYNKTPT